MRIYLMSDPWAERAAHDIEAATLHKWRAAISAIPPARFCAAVVVPELDPVKPHPVQMFHGALWPREVTSPDGFLVVRTGLMGAKLAAAQWEVLAAFPVQIAASEQFLSTDVRGVTRKAVFPGPRLV